MLKSLARMFGSYPIDQCPECLREYWACGTCGASPMGGDKEHPPKYCRNRYCHTFKPVWKSYRWCCQSYGHHLGSVCPHCGQKD